MTVHLALSKGSICAEGMNDYKRNPGLVYEAHGSFRIVVVSDSALREVKKV